MKQRKKIFNLYIFIYIMALACYMLPKTSLYGQSIEEGMKWYNAEIYEQAAKIFEQTNSAEGLLYAAKSYFILGNYAKAKSYLLLIEQNNPPNITRQVAYQLALVELAIDNYKGSVEILYDMIQNPQRDSLYYAAVQNYRSIIQYLTIGQKMSLFNQTPYHNIRTDIIRHSIGLIPYQSIQSLIGHYRNTLPYGVSTSQIDELTARIGTANTYIWQSRQRVPIPQGTVYTIGVILPKLSENLDEYLVAQGLYLGYNLAVEEFNKKYTDRKAVLVYKELDLDNQERGYVESIFHELRWIHHVDVVLGPLFSENASILSQVATMYQIPVIAPLSNTDSLHYGNRYVFQVNPSLSLQAEKLAHFAVQKKNIKSFAILSEKNAIGTRSAYAFRNKVIELGGQIPFFFIEDLRSTGYNITPYLDSLQIKTYRVPIILSDTVSNTQTVSQPNTSLYTPFFAFNNTTDTVNNNITDTLNQNNNTPLDTINTDTTTQLDAYRLDSIIHTPDSINNMANILNNDSTYNVFNIDSLAIDSLAIDSLTNLQDSLVVDSIVFYNPLLDTLKTPFKDSVIVLMDTIVSSINVLIRKKIVDGLYVPFTGDIAPVLIDLVINELRAQNNDLTILSSPEWERANISRYRYGRLSAYYADIKYSTTETKSQKTFNDNYSSFYQIPPNEYSIMGYDIAQYVLNQFELIGNPAYLYDNMIISPNYQGLSTNIKFDYRLMNQSLNIIDLSQTPDSLKWPTVTILGDPELTPELMIQINNIKNRILKK